MNREHAVSILEARNALRCPRAFALGRGCREPVGFPLGDASLGAAFHRVVERFANLAQTPPEALGILEVQDPGLPALLERWMLDLLVWELKADPAYGSLPLEVDELADACRHFAAHVAGRLQELRGPVRETLARLVRSGRQTVEASFPEEGLRLSGPMDALFETDSGELEVVEYRLTQETHTELDQAQVALYRALLQRAQGREVRPVVLRFAPERDRTELEPAKAEAWVERDLPPLMRRMAGWIEEPALAPATTHRALCAVCPLRRLCAQVYPEALAQRDEPPAVACRPRPDAAGRFQTAQVQEPHKNLDSDAGEEAAEAEAEALHQQILEELKLGGVVVRAGERLVGPTLYQLQVVVPRGPVSRLDRAAEDVRHRLGSRDGLSLEFQKQGGLRAFVVQRRNPRVVRLGPLLAGKAAWLGERPGRFVLGQEPSGAILTGDFSDPATPHLLVGGTSGSGKSCLILALVSSLIHFHDPSRIRIALLDPKRVTFVSSAFQAAVAAHLDGPVLFDAEAALPCFEHYVEIMEERYQAFEREGVADLHEYNAIVPEARRLPRFVVVMDEFESLTVDRKRSRAFSAIVQRLGSKARAAGVHLVLATQRPDRSAVDPSIKTNLGGKVALRVASSVNSRIILDAPGAEKLLGRGDLLADLGRGLVRAQAPLM